MLIRTVEYKYIFTLRNNIFDYINVIPIDVMNYLYAGYGDITTYKLTENDKIIRSLYDITQQFESCVETNEDKFDFVMDGNNPYTPRQI